MRFLVPILALTLLVVILIAACKKDNTDIPADFDGMYSGTFHRTGMDTADVTLTFSENTFQGQSSREKYPAICHGSFDAEQGLISFVDSCTWTADFDWSLILNGAYTLSFRSDESIRIWRTNGTVTDEYILRKRSR